MKRMQFYGVVALVVALVLGIYQLVKWMGVGTGWWVI